MLTCLGMLSKSRGQVSRLAAVLHLLFHLGSEEDILQNEIAESAIVTAIDLVKVSCQQMTFLAGRGNLQEELQAFEEGNMTVHIHEAVTIL